MTCDLALLPVSLLPCGGHPVKAAQQTQKPSFCCKRCLGLECGPQAGSPTLTLRSQNEELLDSLRGAHPVIHGSRETLASACRAYSASQALDRLSQGGQSVAPSLRGTDGSPGSAPPFVLHDLCKAASISQQWGWEVPILPD